MPELYADHNISRVTKQLLRAARFAVHDTAGIGGARARDDAQLLIAAERSLVLLTHNRKDFELLHDAWLRWGVQQQHAGILIPPQEWPPQRCAAAIASFLAAAPELANHLYTFDKGRGWVLREPPPV